MNRRLVGKLMVFLLYLLAASLIFPPELINLTCVFILEELSSRRSFCSFSTMEMHFRQVIADWEMSNLVSSWAELIENKLITETIVMQFIQVLNSMLPSNRSSLQWYMQYIDVKCVFMCLTVWCLITLKSSKYIKLGREGILVSKSQYFD